MSFSAYFLTYRLVSAQRGACFFFPSINSAQLQLLGMVYLDSSRCFYEVSETLDRYLSIPLSWRKHEPFLGIKHFFATFSSQH